MAQHLSSLNRDVFAYMLFSGDLAVTFCSVMVLKTVSIHLLSIL